MSDDDQTRRNADRAHDESASRNNNPAAAAHRGIAGENPHQSNHGIGWDRWIELGFTFAILAATVVNVCVANRQWSAMVENNGIARESFTSVQRAFITISDLKIEMRAGLVPGEVGKPGIKADFWWFTPILKNSGNTPSRDLKYFPVASCAPAMGIGPKQAVLCTALPKAGPFDPEDEFSRSKDVQRAHLLIGPQATWPIGGAGILPNFLEAIAISGAKWYVYGAIRYHDIFPGSDEHVTKYCFAIGATSADPAEMKPRYGLCDHWNCADKECEADRKAYDDEVAREPSPPPPPPK